MSGSATGQISSRDAALYGLMGLPLAFVALPLYVFLPHHYATHHGLPLATLGSLLLAARLFDAFSDPLLGRWTDRLFQQSATAVLGFGAGCAALLLAGLTLLYFPPFAGALALQAGLLGSLALTCTACSALAIAHQSWGARLGGDEVQRSRLTGWREGLGLLGVLVASLAPSTLGLPGTVALFAAALALGWLTWWAAPRTPPAAKQPPRDLRLPLRQRAFRSLLGVFMLNGIASAIPATLVLFFVQDRLQAPASVAGYFLAAYFLAAALSMPLWLGQVRRWGLARCWLAGMLLAVAAFAGSHLLGAGDLAAFMGICVLSGATLGADLALPGALLAGVIAQAGDESSAEGAYFGWWNWASKLNLALAAGATLPLLGVFGYQPGARDATSLNLLSAAYIALPCLLKLMAAGLLYRQLVRPNR